MLQDDRRGPRHFSVLGYGTFEDIILKGRQNKRSSAVRWFDRLDSLIHDLDMTQEGMFDARRQPLRNLYQCCIKLEAGLEQRLVVKDE